MMAFGCGVSTPDKSCTLSPDIHIILPGWRLVPMVRPLPVGQMMVSGYGTRILVFTKQHSHLAPLGCAQWPSIPMGGRLPSAVKGFRCGIQNTEEFKRPLIGDMGGVLSIAFSPDGQLLASGSADNLVRLLESTPPEVPFATVPLDVTNIPEPVPPPPAVRDFFDLSPFYQQWINVEGFPVLASEEVNSYALKEAAWVIYQMTRVRPDLLKVIAQDRERLFVLSINESLGDLPEFEQRVNSRISFFVAPARDVAWYGATASEEKSVLFEQRLLLFLPDSRVCPYITWWIESVKCRV